jgi:hypothetical protein
MTTNTRSRSRSRSTSRGRPRRTSERTPLLRRITERNDEDVSPMEDANALAAEVAQQGEGGPPAFPEVRKSRSRNYSHGQLILPDNEDAAIDERLTKFQENGLLEGVSKWKFRCVFGGIVMGYFVRSFFLRELYRKRD